VTHDELLRRALLGRIATALDTVAKACDYTCCWLSYAGPSGQPWRWRLCNPGPHAGRMVGPPCDHLHYRYEVFLA
jgi:hypothetical protein